MDVYVYISSTFDCYLWYAFIKFTRTCKTATNCNCNCNYEYVRKSLKSNLTSYNSFYMGFSGWFANWFLHTYICSAHAARAGAVVPLGVETKVLYTQQFWHKSFDSTTFIHLSFSKKITNLFVACFPRTTSSGSTHNGSIYFTTLICYFHVTHTSTSLNFL